MRIQSGGARPTRWGADAVLLAAAVVGLIAIGAAPPVLAHGVDDREHVLQSDFRGRHPAMTARAPRRALPGSVGPPVPLDAAIRLLFCLEARGAIQRGEFSRQLIDWILHNAHSCRDDWLLTDTFGF